VRHHVLLGEAVGPSVQLGNDPFELAAHQRCGDLHGLSVAGATIPASTDEERRGDRQGKDHRERHSEPPSLPQAVVAPGR
jgi:hypothetical protein